MSLWITTLSPLAQPVENVRRSRVSAVGAIGTIGEPGSARAANLPSRDRPRPPGRPWSVWGDQVPPELEHRAAPRTGTGPGPAAAASISAPTQDPFIATSAPCGATSGIDQRQQPLQGRDRPRGDDVEGALRRAGPRPGPRTHLHRREPEVGHHLLEEGGPAQQRLDQGHASGPAGRWRAPAPAARRRSPRSHTVAPAGIASREHRAVEQVPLPQPGHLARADQAADGARRRPARRRTPRPAAGARR